MDQSGRYRSRIGKPSGLRPPTVRGAAAGACPAAQGIAPCPGSGGAGPSRLPAMQSAMPRPVSRLPEPRIPRAASPPRTRAPSPQRRAIPKATGLRLPGSYAAASRLPCSPRPPRAIPQPKPEAPTASAVPVARVVSPAPRAVSPARTLAVPIPHDSPVAAAVVATPPQRRIPQPSRLRRPAIKTESLVAVPVVQAPGSPPKRILVPESVAASQQETIVAVPKAAPMEEVDRRWAERERRLSLEGAAALPCSPRSPRLSRCAPCTPPQQTMDEVQRTLQTSPLVEAPRSPVEAAAVINQVVVNAAAALDKQEKEEEDAVASALRYIQDQRRRLVLSPERASKAIAKQVLRPAEMRYIDAKWDNLMRELYGDEYADSLSERSHLSPTLPARTISPSADLDRRFEALQRSGAEVALIEDEQMPEFFSPPSEGGGLYPARSVARRLTFGDTSPAARTLSEIAAGSAAVLQALVDTVALEQSERDYYGTIAGSAPPVDVVEFIEDIAPPPEFFAPDIDLGEAIDYLSFDLEDAPHLPPPLLPGSPKRVRALPSPLKPQRVSPLSRRLSPTLRSPIGSPLGSPTACIVLPNRPTSPFSMPPLVSQVQQFMDPGDLEAFMSGACPAREAEVEEEEEEEEEEDLYKILKY